MNARATTWLAWSMLALAALFGGLGCLLFFLNGRPPSGDTWYTLAFSAFALVGVVIASRRPRNPIGWLFCVIGLANGLFFFADEYVVYALATRPGALSDGVWLAWSQIWTAFIMWSLMFFSLLLFPTGRLPSPRWRPVAWALAGVFTLMTVLFVIKPGPLEPIAPMVDNPTGIEAAAGVVKLGEDTVLPIVLIIVLASPASVLVRFWHSRGEERQQLKWLAYAAGFWFSVAALDTLNQYVLREPLIGQATDVLFGAAVAPIPIAVGIAVLRHRLYDIDLIINRTLVYGALTSCVVGIYVLAVGGLGALFESRGNFGVSLIATGLVAVLFQPLRNRFQRGVNRLMYGERDDPYAVISRLGKRLEATLAPDTVLPTVVETIAEALKLPYAAILLKEGERFRTASSYGSPTAEPEALPLMYQREEIGRLLIGPRAPGEGFSDADRSLLEDLARQAGVAVHAVRLTADLQRSRERLVTTREEERRRLRRDLHDGFGPTLASLGLGLNVVRKLMASNELQDADGVLSRLEQETEGTVADVRRLIYGLRPPTLDDLGLVAAIQQQAESQGMVVTRIDTKTVERCENQPVFWLETPEDLPSLPAAVEVAAYRIAQEAITNVARHARARTCRVRLSVDEAADSLLLEITDDGIGMSTGRRAGVGLSSMRERAVELGGTCEVEPIPPAGIRVLARLPLPTSVEPPQEIMTSWSAPSESS